MQEHEGRVDAVLSHIRGSWERSVRRVAHDSHPRLYLPRDYTVPGLSESRADLPYWETYFTNVGLLRHDRIDIVQANIANFAHLIERHGFVPGRSSVSNLGRSEPPYLAQMVSDVFARTEDRGWLAALWSVLVAEYSFWTTKRATEIGLSRYLHHATPHDLVVFYESTIAARPRLEESDERTLCALAHQAMAESESGQVSTPRFRHRCADHVAIDLNANLYAYELAFARFSRVLGRNEEEEWIERADERLARLRRYCWDAALGCFNDYDTVNDATTGIVNAAAFWPLACGIATPSEASSTVRLLRRLERPYGLAACAGSPDTESLAWGPRTVWPPVQVMICRALDRYGHTDAAARVATRFLETVATEFERSGRLWRAYDGETGESAGCERNRGAVLGWTAGAFVELAAYARTAARAASQTDSPSLS